MNVFAVISEYNPFHNGHAYMLTQLRKAGATHIVAIMGGPFLQRGEPALFSKQLRARCALLNGADLVLELPCIWATASAANFALGGVSVAAALGVVDALGFGSECGTVQPLIQLARTMDSSPYRAHIKAHLKQGKSYARAAHEAARMQGHPFSGLLSQPNNVLGVEYIRALHKISSTIQPITVKREGAQHDSFISSGNTASASLIRQALRKQDLSCLKFLPENCRPGILGEIEQGHMADIAYMERAVLYRLRSMSPADFAALPDVCEGLEHRIYQAVRKETSLTSIIDSIKTKRYTHARLRRIMLYAFLDIRTEMQKQPVPYLRVLGFNQKGTEILKKAKAAATLPIITKLTDSFSLLKPQQRSVLELDLKAADLHALAFENILACGQDFYLGPVRV